MIVTAIPTEMLMGTSKLRVIVMGKLTEMPKATSMVKLTATLMEI